MYVPVALLLGVTLGGCAKSREAPARADAGGAHVSAAPEASIAHEHFANPSLRCSESSRWIRSRSFARTA